MPIAAVPASPMDRATPVKPVQTADAKDAILAWFRSEFAAANAIIDALCTHMAQLDGGSEYKEVFEAVHRRRMNWIPVLQMQKYHSITDVTEELRKVAEEKRGVSESSENEKKKGCEDAVEEICVEEKIGEKVVESDTNGGSGGGEVVKKEDSPDIDITDSGSQEVQANDERIDICSNHEDCNGRREQIKLTKGFSAKEHVKGHMVNVVKGLKLYENVFTDSELRKLMDFVNQLQVAGQNGELSGDTFILFNKQMKGNKRELIQFGIPIFGQIKEKATTNNQTGFIEPIPGLLQGVIDHLIQWNLIPEYKRPNGCIIHFFDQDEYSQPFLKPPHLDQPICTLLLSESTMAFGRTLVSDSDGNYRGALLLSLKEGSMLVMRSNSADVARHVMCPSPNKRVSITFFRVRPDSIQGQSPPTSPTAGAMTLWQPGVICPSTMPDVMKATPNWGFVQTPVIMLTPVHPVAMSPEQVPHGGTGVFLPPNKGPRKHVKHLPPRAQRHFLESHSHSRVGTHAQKIVA